MPSIIIDKQDFNNLPNPSPASLTLGFDIDGILKKRDSSGNITPIGAELLISTTRAQVISDISNNELRVGGVYNFTADTINNFVYSEGVEVYMTAITNNTLSKEGYGKFYNPIYTPVLTDINMGIFNPESSYAAGATAIWGGYYWNNNSGTTGDSTDALNLDGNWDKITYNDSNYNVIYDVIEYDIITDFLSSRYELYNNNKVHADISSVNSYPSFPLHPIRYFRWGTNIESDPSILPYGEAGVVECKIYNSLLANINDRATLQYSITMNDKSYQLPIYCQNWVSQINLSFDNYAYQESLTFSNSSQTSINLSKSHQSNINLDGGLQNNIIINTNGYQENITLTGTLDLSYVYVFTSVQENIEISNDSYQNNVLITDGVQKGISLKNESYQDNITITGDGVDVNAGIQTNIILSNDSYQTNISISGATGSLSSQSHLILSNNSYQNTIVIENGSYQSNSTILNNSNLITITISNDSYQDGLYFDNNSSQNNILIDTNSYQEHFLFDSNSYQIDSTLYNAYQEDITINTSSYLDGVNIDFSHMKKVKVENGSSIVSVTLNNESALQYLNLLNQSFIHNANLDYSIIEGLTLNNSSGIDTIDLSSGSQIQNCTLSNDSVFSGLTLSMTDFHHITLNSGLNIESQSYLSQTVANIDWSIGSRFIKNHNVSTYQDTITTATYSVDCSLSNFFELNLNLSTNISFINVPIVYGLTTSYGLILKVASGGYSMGLTGSTFQWSNGTPGALSSGTDVFVFVTTNGGTTWFVNQALSNIS